MRRTAAMAIGSLSGYSITTNQAAIIALSA